MQTSNVKVEKVNKNERTFKMPESSNSQKIRDKVIMAIEVTKRSNVPILFFSNPGYGKTTDINSYARIKGMHVEELIGSQYSQDEILGFQSRTNNKFLEILEPEWYHRIVTYAEPHYERISSGDLFELVEESDVLDWKNKLNECSKNVDTLKAEISKIKSDLDKDSDETNKETLNTNLKVSEMELNKNIHHVEKYTALINDIEWREPRTSILFLDELSTASPAVQGSILNLCFNRGIRGNKKLPKDTIILSAANYKPNLPGFSDIIAPQLNRFCIINLLPGNKNLDNSSSSYEKLGMDLVDEFLQDFKEVDSPIREFKQDFKFNDTTSKMFLKDLRDNLKNIIRKYSGVIDTSRTTLDFRNINFDGIYDRSDNVPEVYNFMSPRSISYYARVVRALCEMGVTVKERDTFNCFVDGLLGLGTNNWSEDGDSNAFLACLTDFHNSLYDMTYNLISKYCKNVSERKVGTDRKIKSDSNFLDTRTITGKVKNILSLDAHGELTETDCFIDVIKQIATEFNASDATKFQNTFLNINRDTNKIIQFRSDFESMKQLLEVFNKHKTEINGLQQLAESLKTDVIDAFEFYYNELASALMEPNA